MCENSFIYFPFQNGGRYVGLFRSSGASSEDYLLFTQLSTLFSESDLCVTKSL